MVKYYADNRRASPEITHMEWEPAKGIEGATAQTQNDEMEWVDDVRHTSSHVEQTPQVAESSWTTAARRHSFASPVLSQSAASHGTSGSMKILQGYTDETLKNHIVKMKDALGLCSVCPPCWINSLNAMHKFDRCPNIAKAYVLVGSKFSTWKELLNLPQWTCYDCCHSQVGPFENFAFISSFSELFSVI